MSTGWVTDITKNKGISSALHAVVGYTRLMHCRKEEGKKAAITCHTPIISY